MVVTSLPACFNARVMGWSTAIPVPPPTQTTLPNFSMWVGAPKRADQGEIFFSDLQLFETGRGFADHHIDNGNSALYPDSYPPMVKRNSFSGFIGLKNHELAGFCFAGYARGLDLIHDDGALGPFPHDGQFLPLLPPVVKKTYCQQHSGWQQ